MPKFSESNPPVRQLRILLRLTQAQFGTRIGVSQRAIQEVERGKNNLKPEHATKLAALYGVLPASLVKGAEKPLTLFGSPWTLRFLESWQKLQFTADDRKLIEDQFVLQLAALIWSAAGLDNGKQKYIFERIADLFEELKDTFHLQRSISDYLETRVQIGEEKSYTVADLDRLLVDVPKWTEIQKKRHFHPSLPATTKSRTVPVWIKQGGVLEIKMPDGTIESCCILAGSLSKKEVTIKVGDKMGKYKLTLPVQNFKLLRQKKTK